MVMSWVFTIMIGISVIFAIVNGTGGQLAAAVTDGAQAGITLAISLSGALCLWSGIGKLLQISGITEKMARLLQPLLRKLFPSSAKDPQLAGALSANIMANFFGLGNAATPMGIQAVKRLKNPNAPSVATDEMCRLIVLNTASIQLIPTTVAAIRASLGSAAPFDILPAVWITSFSSAGIGVAAAVLFGRLSPHE